VVTCALSATIAACFFKPDRPGNGPTDGGTDSATDATQQACGSSVTSCNGDRLEVCVANMLPVETACAWGCIGSGSVAHCGAIDPVGGGVVASDLDTSGLADNIEIDGTIDGDTGAIGTVRLPGSGVVQGIDYKVINNVAVFRFNSVRVGGTFMLTGSHPIAIVASGAITIDGPVNASGDCVNNDAGPGGYPGGVRGMATAGSGAGALGTGTSCGGGGGGHAGSGGNGGEKNDTPAAGGAVFGDAAIATLAGGGGGGAGVGSQGGFGGGGGGALQLVSSTSITVTASSAINAGGCGGKPTSNAQPGGGGGAGGTIVLEAPVVTIDGPLGANGGGGAGGDALGQPGQDGITDPVGASGGAGGMSTQYGGSGAAASNVNGTPALGGAVSSGGGGGAAGRIRITTKSGQIAGTATITPSVGSPGAKIFAATVH